MNQTKPIRILMAVTNDLVTDQRVHRTCLTLCQAGCRVTLVGRRFRHSQPLQRAYRTLRMRLLFNRSAFFYAEYNLRLFLLLLFCRADAFYANDTDTLWACSWAARLRQKKLYFDAHELFTEVPELVGRQRVRQVWQWIERTQLPHVTQAFTVCQSVADEYARRYGVAMQVMRNFPFQLSQAPAPESPQAPYMLLYQGAVNVGRGLREAVDVLQFLPECRLVVAGVGDEYQHLCRYATQLPWADRIEFKGRVEPSALQSLTRQAALGLCLLENRGLNYYYALPNRVGDFAQAGVPLLATDFPEVRRIADRYGVISLTQPCPSIHEGENYAIYLNRLASDIRQALSHWTAMPAERRQSLFASARQDLCWEQEQQVLTSVFGGVS